MRENAYKSRVIV